MAVCIRECADIRNSILDSETRNAKLTSFTCNELCFVFDNLYGYPGRGILYEDTVLEQAGLDKALADFGAVGAHTKELLLSTDWVDYFMGMMQLTNAAGEVINAGITPDVELVKTDTDGQKDYPP